MLTPLEVENKRFSKQMMNGYSVNEVDEFLDKLTLDYEKMYKLNIELKEKIDELESSISHYKTIEDTLQNTLLMAQGTAEEIKKMAHQQAETIIKESELTAKEAIAQIREEKVSEMRNFEDLKKQTEVFRARMEALLISQLELLKDIDG
ncbi:MAG: DivIVA domain-containing protein [Oscillospiraceae bacterium]|nr:DivIVA domain-containing protein [Oscillospiraceae bacterium]